ncbi:bridging integrator 3-like [Saccopteryx leptura]|uniref:bridging integrator 3-like n=1 Tax=Saccopteryx leptura TaxID=249018 RepID=UPI00339C0212
MERSVVTVQDTGLQQLTKQVKLFALLKLHFSEDRQAIDKIFCLVVISAKEQKIAIGKIHRNTERIFQLDPIPKGRVSLDSFSNPLSEQDQDILRTVTVLGMAMKRKDAVNQKKVNKIQKILSEPFKKFGSVFPSFSMAMKQPKQALQGCRRLKAKVEKYKEKEKTEPVLAKLHQAQDELQLLQDNLEAKLKQRLDEMLCFYNSQLDNFQSSFEFLVPTQMVHYSKMPEIFGDLTQHLDQPDHPDKQQDWENVIKLSEPRALLLWLMTEWPVTLGRLLGHKLVSLVFSSLIPGSQAKTPSPRERMAAGGLGTEVAPALPHQLFRMSPVPGTPSKKIMAQTGRLSVFPKCVRVAVGQRILKKPEISSSH